MNITFEITDKDLEELDDHSLFHKLWENYKDKYNFLNFNNLTEEITIFINKSRGRNLCKTCEGAGLIYGNRCLNCRGNGFKY